jgi:hypothetical protein
MRSIVVTSPSHKSLLLVHNRLAVLIILIDLKGFWRWCMLYRTVKFLILDSIHRLVYMTNNYLVYTNQVSVGIATDCWMDDRSSCPCRGKRSFYTPQSIHRLWSPPSFLCNTYWVLFSRVKRPGSETDRSPPSSVEIKNVGYIPSLPNKA